MNKVLAAVVATTFAWGSASGFAADAAKKTELTNEERMELRIRAEKLAAERTATPLPAKKQELTQEEKTELRNRAAKLATERAATPVPAKSTVETTTKTKKHHIKPTTPEVKQTQPKA
jgi:hypothetical protein